MILHTLNKSFDHPALFESILAVIEPKDSLLLIEDGAYWGMKSQAVVSFIDRLPAQIELYVIQADASARGIETLNPSIKTISYDEFVSLSAQCAKVLSWY